MQAYFATQAGLKRALVMRARTDRLAAKSVGPGDAAPGPTRPGPVLLLVITNILDTS